MDDLLLAQAVNGDDQAAQPQAEITTEDLIATIGELEVHRRALVSVNQGLRAENAALRARIGYLEAAGPNLEGDEHGQTGADAEADALNGR